MKSIVSITVLLFASCSSFQTKLHRISATMNGRQLISSNSLQRSKCTDPNYMIPFDPSSASNFSGQMRNGTSTPSNSNASNDFTNISINGNSKNNYVQDKTNTYTLGIPRHYFEQMEERSGKDYRWIKP